VSKHSTNPQTAVERHTLSRTSLVLIMGVAGSGKSTVAHGLLSHLNMVYLDNNFVADAFFPEVRHGLEYRRIRPRLYRALYRIAEENLRIGNSVLLDAPHIRQSRSEHWYRSMISLTEGVDAGFVILRCTAPVDVIRQRLELRNEPRDKRKLKEWADYVHAQPIAGPLPHRHHDLRTDRSIELTVREAVHYILTEVGCGPRAAGQEESGET